MSLPQLDLPTFQLPSTLTLLNLHSAQHQDANPEIWNSRLSLPSTLTELHNLIRATFELPPSLRTLSTLWDNFSSAQDFGRQVKNLTKLTLDQHGLFNKSTDDLEVRCPTSLLPASLTYLWADHVACPSYRGWVASIPSTLPLKVLIAKAHRSSDFHENLSYAASIPPNLPRSLEHLELFVADFKEPSLKHLPNKRLRVLTLLISSMNDYSVLYGIKLAFESGKGAQKQLPRCLTTFKVKQI